MFERFSDQARRVLVLAQEEARLTSANHIGTEHILLGLIHEDDSVAAQVLAQLGVRLDTARAKVTATVSLATAGLVGSPPFTPRAKKVLELSLREALQLGHNYIGPEHVLLGIVREGEGVAAQVLVALGVELDQVRQTVIQLLSGYPGGDTRSPVGSQGMAGRGIRPGPVFMGPRVPPSDTCSFCGRDLWDVGRYVAGPWVVICEDCLGAATGALQATPASSGEIPFPPRLFGPAPDEEAVDAVGRAFQVLASEPLASRRVRRHDRGRRRAAPLSD